MHGQSSACARAEKALSNGDAHACAPRASAWSAAADSLDVVAEEDHVKHVEEKHELEHDEKAEPVHAALHAGELARAARLRERGPRARKLAARKSLPNPS